MKILYYYGRLNLGGAERSSVRLVNAFVQQGHEVDLLLKWQGGALENELDPRVRIIAFKKANRFTEKYTGKRWHGIPVMSPIVFAARLFQIVRSNLLQLYLSLKKPKYDLTVIGYHGLNPKIALKTSRAQATAMIMRHSSSVSDHDRSSAKFIRDFSDSIDAFICVSKYVKNLMIENYPDLKDKAYCIYNFLEVDQTKEQELPDAYKGHNSKLVILTLGRIDAEHKGLFRIVEACKELVKHHQNFRWVVVGDGKDKQAVNEKITEAGLEETIVMHPGVKNPFPYYQHADLVAVLSLHEGLCGVVNEAKIMEAPLIATRFSAIDEQITHGSNGYIVDNNLPAIIEGLSELLTNHQLRKSLAKNELPQALLNNDSKIKQYEALAKELSGRRSSHAS